MPYRIAPSSNTHTRKQKSSNLTEHDLKVTSNDHKKTSKDANEYDSPVSKEAKSRNRIRGSGPNDIFTQRSILIEQAFFSAMKDWVQRMF